jgi:hypothetical protein
LASAVSNPRHLSFAQERFWFLSEFESNRSIYNSSKALHISGRLDSAALQQSINNIIRRHELLRTIYPIVDGMPRPSVLSDVSL